MPHVPPPSSTYCVLKGLKRVVFSLCTTYYSAPLLRVPSFDSVPIATLR